MLERIWHAFMMRNERLTKAIVLGWWEELEKWEKKSEKKRKMILHWKRILREAGIDWTDGQVCKNKGGLGMLGDV